MNQVPFNRTLVLVNGAVPLLVLLWDAYRGQLGANSVNYALHVTGILSLVFLFLSLTITPLRWITGWGGWIAFRRTLGLYGFFYSIIHFTIYLVWDREFSFASTLHEIGMRRFLQVGTASIFLMVPLAATSTNGMIKRLGPKRWKLLHRLTYIVVILGVVHYYMLVKSDVRQPVIFAMVLTGLLGARAGRHYYELRKAVKKNSASTAKQKAIDSAKNRNFWSGQLKVGAIFQETHDVKTFRLVDKDGGSMPFNYAPGQYMNLRLTIDGKRVNRSYTIASSPTRRDACELSIKREADGLASRFLHDYIGVGDLLQVSAPAGKFVFRGDESEAVLLIAGGVGITPLMSITRFLTDRAWKGDIYFVVIAKTERDVIFHDELAWLERRCPNLHVCITLTRLDSNSSWSGDRGRASREMFNRFVPSLRQLPVYLCGPVDMMNATCELLSDMGVPSSQIHTEEFISPLAAASNQESIRDDSEQDDRMASEIKANPEIASGESTTITFARSNLQSAISFDTSILEAAEESSVELPFECRSGICGQCKTRLIEGSVFMEFDDALSPAEKASGLVLACQACPRSKVIVDA